MRAGSSAICSHWSTTNEAASGHARRLRARLQGRDGRQRRHARDASPGARGLPGSGRTAGRLPVARFRSRSPAWSSARRHWPASCRWRAAGAPRRPSSSKRNALRPARAPPPAAPRSSFLPRPCPRRTVRSRRRGTRRVRARTCSALRRNILATRPGRLGRLSRAPTRVGRSRLKPDSTGPSASSVSNVSRRPGRRCGRSPRVQSGADIAPWRRELCWTGSDRRALIASACTWCSPCATLRS